MVCIYFFFQEIEFPAITVCNLNKLEASSMYDLVNSVQNSSLTEPEKWGVLQKEYYDGHDNDLTEEELDFLTQFKKENLYYDYYDYDYNDAFTEWNFLDTNSQHCNHAFMRVSYGGKKLTWEQLPAFENTSDYWDIKFGPKYFPTDYGTCCEFVPHLYFEPRHPEVSYEDFWFKVKAKAQNGESNGLEIVLNAEHFNYGEGRAAGFRISLHSHNSKVHRCY